MFREFIVVRQFLFAFFFSFLASGALQGEAFQTSSWPSQAIELPAEGETTFYGPALAEQTLELEVHGAGILLLEMDDIESEGAGPVLIGSLQGQGGAHWMRQQGDYLSLAFTRAGIHHLRVIQGGLPQALQGVFVPTPVDRRQMLLPTAQGVMQVERIQLLDPVDGSEWVGLLEMRDPARGASQQVDLDLSWVSQHHRVEGPQGDLYQSEMVITLRNSAGTTWKNGQGTDPNPPDDEVDPNPSGLMTVLGAWKNGQGTDPNPPDDEVDPNPSGLTAVPGAWKNGQGTDPNPPDDEVDPNPSGLMTVSGAWKNGQGTDPNPPDDEVDPNPSGLMTVLGAWKNGQGTDPNPPDDEVDPNPSGLMAVFGTWKNGQGTDPNPPDDEVDPNPSGFVSADGILAHQLRLQVLSTASVQQDEEAMAILAWLNHALLPDLGVEVPTQIELRGVTF